MADFLIRVDSVDIWIHKLLMGGIVPQIGHQSVCNRALFYLAGFRYHSAFYSALV